MSDIKSRESNIELLRIISMAVIVYYHFASHAILPNSPQFKYLSMPVYSVMHIGVVCFVLISGYHGIKFSLHKFIRLLLYCVFYSVLIFTVGVILKPELFSFTGLIKSFVPYQWWYIPVYLCLYLISPLFVTTLQKANREKKIAIIVLLFIVSFGFGQFIPALQDGKNPINFILIYCVGNYLRTELNIPKKFTVKKLAIIYFVFNALIFMSITIFNANAPTSGEILYRLFYPYNSIGLLINAVIFFMIFMNIKFSSKIVNWVASSTLAVYLLHENQYIGRYIYDYIINLLSVTGHSFTFYSTVLIMGMIVFISAILIDKLVSPIVYWIAKYINSMTLVEYINDKIQNAFFEEKNPVLNEKAINQLKELG